MLTSMRKQKKYLNIVLWIVILAFLATIVVVWGVGDKQNQLNYVAKVGNYTISYNEYRNAYNARAANLRSIGQELPKDKAFEKAVLMDMINRQLLIAEAKRLGIPVSDAEVAREITANAVFMNSDVFDVERYQQVLANSGYTPFLYEEGVRTDILVKKMIDMISGAVAVTDEEILYEYHYSFAGLSSSYFTVNAERYKKMDVPDDATLQAYYESVREDYRLPPSIKLKYIAFNESDFEYTPAITDTDVQNRYMSSIATFTTPESVELSQIVALVMNWDNESQVQAASEKINTALQALDNGTSFHAVIKNFPEDGTSGIIGTINRPPSDTEMSSLEKMIFSLPAGGHTGIIRSDYGFHIYRVDNQTEAVVTPFENVKDNLRATMITEARNSAFRSYLYSIYRDITATGNITAYLAKNPGNFKVTETKFLSENDPNAFFQSDEDLKRTLFSLMKTEVSPLMELDGNTYLYEVEDRINSYTPPLEEIRQTVLDSYRKNLAFSAAIADVNAKAQPNNMPRKDFAKLAAQFQAKITTIPKFKHIDTMPELEWADELVNILFTKKDGDLVIFPQETNDLIYVIHVNEITLPPAEDLEERKNDIKTYLLSLKQADVLEGVLRDLRTKNNIQINPNYE